MLLEVARSASSRRWRVVPQWIAAFVLILAQPLWAATTVVVGSNASKTVITGTLARGEGAVTVTMATDNWRSHEPPVGLPVRLMHPTLVARPFHREGWIYEEKYDGWRLVGYKSDGQAWLLSRNHRDHTQRFPALAAAIAALAPPTLILDGEVVIFDAQLISRFEWLRRRDPEAVATPPIYMVFDLLRTGPHDLRGEPLRARRAALERLVSSQNLIFPARRLAASGLTAWEEVQQRGYEGLVAKDEASS